MMRVNVIVAPSLIPNAGLGLFAAEDIAKGTIICRFDPDFDRILDALPEDPIYRAHVLKYGYQARIRPTKWMLEISESKYMNHSDTPNTIDFNDDTIAACLIKKGEEITSDYRSFDINPFSGFDL